MMGLRDGMHSGGYAVRCVHDVVRGTLMVACLGVVNRMGHGDVAAVRVVGCVADLWMLQGRVCMCRRG